MACVSSLNGIHTSSPSRLGQCSASGSPYKTVVCIKLPAKGAPILAMPVVSGSSSVTFHVTRS